MQLAEAKGCFLRDVYQVPAEELPLWLAFYRLENEAREKAERKAARKAKAKR